LITKASKKAATTTKVAMKSSCESIQWQPKSAGQKTGKKPNPAFMNSLTPRYLAIVSQSLRTETLRKSDESEQPVG